MVGVWIMLLGLSGAALGWKLGKVRSHAWLVGFFAAIVLMLLITSVRHFPMLRLHAPLHLLVAGRSEFILLAFTAPVMMFSLIPRLPQVRLRWMLGFLCVLFVGWFCSAPFVMTALVRDQLLSLPSQIDPDGVCRQTTSYTCGPAATVTALRMLGVESTEGPMAVLLRTTPAGGIELDLATDFINDAYAKDGIHAEYRVVKSIADLPPETPILAVIKFSLFEDHVVTITHDGAGQVIVRDPASGKRIETLKQFDSKFRGEAVVLTRRMSSGSTN